MSIENPPAFPHPVPVGCWGDPSCGMTLRDYFAGQALAGFLAGKPAIPEKHKDKSEDVLRAAIADVVYDIADAMLTARQKGTPDE